MTDFDLTKELRGATKVMDDLLGDLGGVDTPELKSAAKALMLSMRKTLRQKKGAPSGPGEPPAAEEGRLAGSVRDGVLGAARWVGPTDFKAPWLEEGVDDRKHKKGPGNAAHRALGRLLGRNRLEKRPFMDRSLAAAQGEMTDVMVSGIQRRKDL